MWTLLVVWDWVNVDPSGGLGLGECGPFWWSGLGECGPFWWSGLGECGPFWWSGLGECGPFWWSGTGDGQHKVGPVHESSSLE
uniref:Uncharacterized protein n=1 Tax=Sphaeramia orbicularis TaxID=375764 RepID=A0A672ZC21_9TELE